MSATPAPVPSMTLGLTVLVSTSVIGEILHRCLALPVSGPVLGIVLLIAVFAIRRGVPASLEAAGMPLLRNLSVFFVPSGVGLMNQFHLLGSHWPAIAAAMLGSSVLCLLATGFCLRGLEFIRAGVAAEDAP